MPITLAVLGDAVEAHHLDTVFDHFTSIDARFSPFRADSELARLNRGEVDLDDCSAPMREVLDLCDRTKKDTLGYFNIRRPDGRLDPSGVVKGWAVLGAARLLAAMGFTDFYVDAGGDIQAAGHNEAGEAWRIGIRSPFNLDRLVKRICPHGAGVATSGNYLQGAHIYDPHSGKAPAGNVVSLTVIGRDVLEADRYATAAFAMGRDGIVFLEGVPEIEAYEIDATGQARMTSGWARYQA